MIANQDATNFITLRHPEVFRLTVLAAAAHVRTQHLHHQSPTTPTSLLPSTVTVSLLDLNNESEDEDEELAEETPFIVQVQFIKEQIGWASAVYQVRVIELQHQQTPETWAIKIRISSEKDNADASNARAYGTMIGLWHVYRYICPEPLHYVKRIAPTTTTSPTPTPTPTPTTNTANQPFGRSVTFRPPRNQTVSPTGRITTPNIFNATHRSLRHINNIPKFYDHCATATSSSSPVHLSAIVCTWITGGSTMKAIGTDMTDKLTRNKWSKLMQLKKKIAAIKKPKIGSASYTKQPKYTKWLTHIRDMNDHDLWLHNLQSRVAGLEYVYASKVAQGIVPAWLDFLAEIDAQTGLVYLKGLAYRLNACLKKLQAIKRDDEDTQDMCLFIGDPSLDNIIWNHETHQGTVVDLECSGWTDPAYIVAELLTNNVWLDKYGLKNNHDLASDDAPFPFTNQFELRIVQMFVTNYTWSKSNNPQTKDDVETKFNEFLERVELHKEFCAIKQLLFHLRGALHELGNVIDGFRVHVDTCGSASGSGGGGTLGNKSVSPGKMHAFEMHPQLRYQSRPKGRSSSSPFLKRVLFRGTHEQGIQVYSDMLQKSNYMRRSMGEYLEFHNIIDQIRAEEKKKSEIADRIERRRLRLACHLGEE